MSRSAILGFLLALAGCAAAVTPSPSEDGTSPVGGAADSWWSDDECEDESECEGDLRCIGGSCVERSELGGNCDDGDDYDCAGALVCSLHWAGGNEAVATCEQPCASDAECPDGKACLFDDHLETRICVRRLSEDAACSNDAQCEEGLVCRRRFVRMRPRDVCSKPE